MSKRGQRSDWLDGDDDNYDASVQFDMAGGCLGVTGITRLADGISASGRVLLSRKQVRALKQFLGCTAKRRASR